MRKRLSIDLTTSRRRNNEFRSLPSSIPVSKKNFQPISSPRSLMERSGGAPPKDVPIEWPEISTKRQPAEQVHVQQLANKDGSLFIIPSCLTENECRSLVRAVEDAGGFELPPLPAPAAALIPGLFRLRHGSDKRKTHPATWGPERAGRGSDDEEEEGQQED